jgi:hypothetical protein
MTVTVINLFTKEKKIYTCSSREAVIAAYAQEKGDWNTWQYKERYDKLVLQGRYTLLCGDWSTLKDEKIIE